ncbi:MAG: hypothetical protein ACFBWO_08115 [Paracoccaceae bacterium]
MSRTLSLSLAALLASASLSLAQDETPCPMSYAQFEFAVPHLDVETCPESLAGEARFCRVSAGNDVLHVYAFAEDGEQCLIAMTSIEEDGYALDIE